MLSGKASFAEDTGCQQARAPVLGMYWDETRPGTYLKSAVSKLFDAETKFDAGWMAEFLCAASDALATREDLSLGMRRIEVLCARCVLI